MMRGMWDDRRGISVTGGVRILGGCEGDGKGVKVVGGTYCISVGRSSFGVCAACVRSAMKEACTWLSSNCQPKDILMKWSPLSLAIGWVPLSTLH